MLDLNFFYRSIIKTISLILLTSWAIHAVDDNPMTMNPTQQPNIQTKNVTPDESAHENIPRLQMLSPEILDNILQYLDPRSFMALSQTSHQLQNEIFDIHFLSNEKKQTANEYISNMFRNHFFVDDNISIADLIKNAFDPHNISCINIYKSCAAMTEFPSEDLINNLVHSFPNRPLGIFTLASHHTAFFTANMDEETRIWITQSLTHLSPQHIKEFAQALNDNRSKLFTTDMNGCNRAEIIIALAHLSPQHIAELSNAISHIYREDMNGCLKTEAIKIFSRFSVDKINRIATHAAPIFTTKILWSDQSHWLINAIARHTPDQIARIAAQFSPTMPFTQKMRLIIAGA